MQLDAIEENAPAVDIVLPDPDGPMTDTNSPS